MTPTVSVKPATSQYRWVICALLFFATVIAYVDRSVLANLETYLEKVFNFDKEQYSNMTAVAPSGSWSLRAAPCV